MEQEFVSGFAAVNLTVERDHTFAVGTAGLLVHNTSKCAQPVAADIVTDNVDATENLRRLHADVLDDALVQGKPSGSYINQHASGTPYIGKGGSKRAAQSTRDVAKRTGDSHVSTQWESAIDDTQGLIDEARKFRQHGGIENLHNRINSPGEKL